MKQEDRQDSRKLMIGLPIEEIVILLSLIVIVCSIVPHLPDIREMARQWELDQEGLRFEPTDDRRSIQLIGK